MEQLLFQHVLNLLRDKPSVEGSVGYISRQIIASLRYYQCFSLDDLNSKILEEVDKLNDEPFQKRKAQEELCITKRKRVSLIPLRYPQKLPTIGMDNCKVQLGTIISK